jgi:hypothetical protein
MWAYGRDFSTKFQIPWQQVIGVTTARQPSILSLPDFSELSDFHVPGNQVTRIKLLGRPKGRYRR